MLLCRQTKHSSVSTITYQCNVFVICNEKVASLETAAAKQLLKQAVVLRYNFLNYFKILPCIHVYVFHNFNFILFIHSSYESEMISKFIVHTWSNVCCCKIAIVIGSNIIRDKMHSLMQINSKNQITKCFNKAINIAECMNDLGRQVILKNYFL